VLAQTTIIAGGTGCCWRSKPSSVAFHLSARVTSAACDSRQTAAGEGARRAVPRSAPTSRRWISSQSLKYFGSGRPESSATGTRGTFVMPDSMASTSPKSLTSQGSGVPCG